MSVCPYCVHPAFLHPSQTFFFAQSTTVTNKITLGLPPDPGVNPQRKPVGARASSRGHFLVDYIFDKGPYTFDITKSEGEGVLRSYFDSDFKKALRPSFQADFHNYGTTFW